MSQDTLLPIAPARVKALVLPLGSVHRERFEGFVQRLNQEQVVHLRDISPDGRPNRNMFSPLAFPDGAMFYDLITHVPPSSHLALSPFDLFREPLAVLAIADGAELEKAIYNKRHSAQAQGQGLTKSGLTKSETNIRALYQDLESLRDAHPKALAHQVLIFDYVSPSDNASPVTFEGIKTVPPVEQSKRTTMKTVMCDISSMVLAEMETLARSFEGMSIIESPGHAPARPQINGSYTTEDASTPTRRNSQFSVPSITRSTSSGGMVDRTVSRMSMPVPFKNLSFGSSSSSTPSGRPSTPARSILSQPPTTFEEMTNGAMTDVGSSENHKSQSRPGTAEGFKSSSRDRVSVQGFGPGGVNEKWRNKGKGRATVLVGSLYLQAGRWADALRELVDGATTAKSVNDHLWHGKALELIAVCLFLFGWADLEFLVPTICIPPVEKPSSSASKQEPVETNTDQPKRLFALQSILPDLLERIISLYTRMTGEQLPFLLLSETIIRFCNTLTALHLCRGKLNRKFLEMVVTGNFPSKSLTTSPRLGIIPSRSNIVGLLFKAFPSTAQEVLTIADRAIILGGIASVLGNLGFQRKKAMVVRKLIIVLITGLVEARTRGAAEVGIHPAAGLVALDTIHGHNNGAGALELGEGDIEQGIDAFLGLMGRIYGVVGLDGIENPRPDAGPVDNSDEKIIARIRNQSAARHFGFQSLKLNVLRSCISFSEALPDFNGVLKFSSHLLRTAGSGVAPGSRREDAAPVISREEQIRLTTNISKTSNLSRRLGLNHLTAEYWDEFLIRGISLDPLPTARAPVPHAKTMLPGVSTARTSQDVNPFIYNPFVRTTNEAAVERTLVVDEPGIFRVTLQNPYDIDVDVQSIRLDTQGAKFESSTASTVIGPYRTQILKVSGTPKTSGSLKITGTVVEIRGCRERRFPIFTQCWAPETYLKVKGVGLATLEKNKALPAPGPTLRPEAMSLGVISAQPVLVVQSSTLSQSAIMILEGERQVFSITLQNLSSDTPADLVLFSFQDSTQDPLQTALANRDATPAELYEYELVLAKKQALRLRKPDNLDRFIAPKSSRTFEFEILGKPGLVNATVQIDYAHLGVPHDQVQKEFHTRQVCLDLTVTVNASVELSRIDVIPVQGQVPRALWHHLGVNDLDHDALTPDKYCLLLMDLRNAWPSHMQVRLSGSRDLKIEEFILPGNTTRVVFPIPRIYLEDPHASIPALNPSRQRQFVVSSSKTTPEAERATREAFWFRERVLDALSAEWKTLSGPPRRGTVELRGIRLSARMIEALKVDEVGIDISVAEAASPRTEKSEKSESDISATNPSDPAPSTDATNKITDLPIDQPLQLRVRITNRTAQPIHPTLRIMPALRHRPINVALDFTRKLAWNGVLQRFLPPLPARSHVDVVLGMTFLCRGDFEFLASVEETRLWKGDDGGVEVHGERRQRSETQLMMDAVLGAKERRIWHTRYRSLVRVVDPVGEDVDGNEDEDEDEDEEGEESA